MGDLDLVGMEMTGEEVTEEDRSLCSVGRWAATAGFRCRWWALGRTRVSMML